MIKAVHNKLLFGIILGAALLFFLSFLTKVHAQAKEYYYDHINVDYQLNKDSTVEVTEEMTLNFTGEFHGTDRAITLSNPNTLQQCQSNPSLQCGGFDFMYIEGVYGENGRQLNENEYTVDLEELSSGEKRIDVKYEFAPDGRYFSGQNFTWKIKYKVFGNIGYFPDYQLLYWNSIFEDRTVDVNKVNIRVFLPQDIDISKSDVRLPLHSEANVNYSNKVVSITSEEVIPPGDPFTFLLKLPKDLLPKSATIKLIANNSSIFSFIDPQYNLVIEGHKVIQNSNNEFHGIPIGHQKLEFASDNYESVTFEGDLKSGETREIQVNPKPNSTLIMGLLLCLFCNGFGLLLIIFGVAFPIYRWRKNGRDQGGKKTIIPLFSPPDGISPSLLGSLKDETVDLVDITSTIIDTAYRGYVKIKETDKSGRNFELTKLKDLSDLKVEEKKIMESIFDGRDLVTTLDLQNSFYLKIPRIQDTIYQEMVNKGYFTRRPDQVRGLNLGIGIGIIILSVILTIGLTAVTAGLALIFCLTPLMGLFLAGLFTTILSGFMPAKTPLGTETLEQVKGFRMYLYTAERFRMQNLTPEMFEKYLSYAIVFGIEKEWAAKFKDIYKGHPDWYEGYDASRPWTPLLFVNSLSTFNTVATSVISSRPQSSSSSGWSGGGWSGGGGFGGGFSGGGSGGGGGGAW